MRLPLTLVAVLLVSLAAGCIGAPGKTMTAREGLDDARSAAEEWAEGETLDLVGAVAIEPFKRVHYESDDGEDEAEYVTHLDGNPGDGKAPGWAYAFYDGERCISVVLAAGLGVLAEGYETCDDDIEVTPDWSVDSDEVAEILQAREDWPDLGEDGTYFWGLFAEEGLAIWTVGGSGEDEETVFASVDASSGEVLAVVHEVGGDIEAVFEAEVGSSGAVVSGSDEDSDSAAYLTAGATLVAEVDLEGVGQMSITFSQNGGVTPHTVTIEGPFGTVDEFDVGPTVGFGNVLERHGYDGLPIGHYTVTLTANTAALLPSLDVHAEW
ncbi:MAG: hypothetical protein WC876_04165 [Candidatus Thermoplasmatota archaeon]|jgi:hypothetical protein